MDIIQLKYFKTLAELENMSKAANELHIAQSALSRSLSNLEREFDLLFFDRIGKRILLNDSGEILLKYTNRILQEIEDAKIELNEHKTSIYKNLNLLVHAGNTSISEIIFGFKCLYPDTAINIIQKPINEEIDVDIDIAIYPSMTPASGENSKVLFVEEMCLAVPIGHEMSGLKKIELKELSNQPLIIPAKTIGFREVVDRYCRMDGFEPKIAIESDSPNIAYDLISKGLGVSLIPKISWDNLEHSSQIKLVEVVNPKCTYYINMVWNDKRYDSKVSSLMRNYLIEYFENKSSKHTEK